MVFGREASGLTNLEMDHCNQWIYIPGFGKTNSLNISQAVILVLYEIVRSLLSHDEPEFNEYTRANSFLIEGLKNHLFEVLNHIRYLRKGHEAVVWTYFSDLIARAKLNEHDVKLLRGFFNKIL